MLQITIPEQEFWDEKEEQFITKKELTLTLEHSLVSISKWEAKWHKAFLGKEEKTVEQVIDYVKCMTLTQNVSSEVYDRLSPENIEEIKNYINDPYTATVIYEDPNAPKTSRETITSELVYYWMIALGIPVEFQKWHLNRLLTLIRVCEIKNKPPKKMSQRQIMSRNAALNAARRQKLGTKG